MIDNVARGTISGGQCQIILNPGTYTVAISGGVPRDRVNNRVTNTTHKETSHNLSVSVSDTLGVAQTHTLLISIDIQPTLWREMKLTTTTVKDHYYIPYKTTYSAPSSQSVQMTVSDINITMNYSSSSSVNGERVYYDDHGDTVSEETSTPNRFTARVDGYVRFKDSPYTRLSHYTHDFNFSYGDATSTGTAIRDYINANNREVEWEDNNSRITSVT